MGGTLTDRRFTGQREEESGLGSLYDYGARLYSPLLGRLLSADTIVPDPHDPQQLNRYAYSRNNPVKYTDPTGHYIFEDEPTSTWIRHKDSNVPDAQNILVSPARAASAYGVTAAIRMSQQTWNYDTTRSGTDADFFGGLAGVVIPVLFGAGIQIAAADIAAAFTPAAVGAGTTATTATAECAANPECAQAVQQTAEKAGLTAQEAWDMFTKFLQGRQGTWRMFQNYDYMIEFRNQMYNLLNKEVPIGWNYIGTDRAGTLLNYWNLGDLLTQSSEAVAQAGLTASQLQELIEFLGHAMHLPMK